MGVFVGLWQNFGMPPRAPLQSCAKVFSPNLTFLKSSQTSGHTTLKGGRGGQDGSPTKGSEFHGLVTPYVKFATGPRFMTIFEDGVPFLVATSVRHCVLTAS